MSLATPTVRSGFANKQYGEVALTAGQLSTNSYATVDGTELIAAGAQQVTFTFKSVTQSLTFQVQGALLSDFSDVVDIGSSVVVAAAAFGHALVALSSMYKHLRVQVKSTNSGQHGTGSVAIYVL